MSSPPPRFQLEVAGVRLDVWASPELELSFFEPRAKLFRRNSGPPELRIELRRRSAVESPTPFEPARCSEADGRVVVAGGGARVEFGSPAITAVVEASQDGVPFENVLRFVVSRELLRRGGLLLHAAGLERDGRAVVFPGVSGAGKSTLVLRHPETERISEDMLAVRKIDGRWHAESVPFFAFNRLLIGPRRAPLLGFAFLRKSAAVRAHPMPARECPRRLARSVVLFAPAGVESLALDRLLELAREVPAFDFELDRSSPVWPELLASFSPSASAIPQSEEA